MKGNHREDCDCRDCHPGAVLRTKGELSEESKRQFDELGVAEFARLTFRDFLKPEEEK